MLAPYQDFFVQLGVRERFQCRDYVFALERLARCNHGQTLEPEQLTLASKLAKDAAQYKMSNAEKSALWLPDATGEMTQVQCLVYDDAPWLSSTLSDVQFLHKDISNDVAEALGLRSVRKLLISGELHMRDLACPPPEWYGLVSSSAVDDGIVCYSSRAFWMIVWYHRRSNVSQQMSMDDGIVCIATDADG